MSKQLTLGSLFDGSGGFPLGAALCGIKPVWASEVEPFPISVTKKRFPNMEHLGNISNIDGAEVKPVDIITFGSPCFPAGVFIHTARGKVSIENVEVGDFVLTHKGNMKKVVKVGNKLASTLILSDGTTQIECTPNHPFYCLDNVESSRKFRYVDKEFNAHDAPYWNNAENMLNKLWSKPLIFDTNYLVHEWYKVDSVVPSMQEKTVYNIEVEDDHSYIANGIVVHNCQDLSVAGSRAGLSGERSGLFHEAIRVITEMRRATNGKYPRYTIWENVCFGANTLITTINGYKKIKDIKNGDYVLTHKGKFRRVLKKYKNTNLAYELKASGLLPLKVTGNHPFYVCKNNHTQPFSTTEPFWEKVSNLNKNYYVGYKVDFYGKKSIGMANAYAVGRWLADGSIVLSKNRQARIFISTGYKKYHSTKTELNRLDIKINENKLKQAVNFNFYSNSFYNLIKSCKKGALHKQLPNYIWELKKDEQKELLRGYLDGNGCFRKSPCNECIFSSSSIQLFMGICKLIRNVYHVGVSVSINNLPKKVLIENRVVNAHKSFIGSFAPPSSKNRRSGGQSFYKNGFVWQKVNSVIEKGVINVYNLSVEKEHTYEANGASVHNCGAFSSQNGADFFCVLREFANINKAKLPETWPEKWMSAGTILADSWSLAWRVFDAEFWGVPQRRKRIFLVTDLNGQSAEKILFNDKSMSGYFESLWETWKKFAESPCWCTKASSRNLKLFRNHGQTDDYDELDTIADTVCATYGMGGATKPYVVNGDKINKNELNKKSNNQQNCISSNDEDSLYIENHAQDCRYNIKEDVADTVTARYGTGGNNSPFVLNKSKDKKCFVKTASGACVGDIGKYEERDKSRTLNCLTGTIEGCMSDCWVVDMVAGKSNCGLSEGVSPTLSVTHGGKHVINDTKNVVMDSTFNDSTNENHSFPITTSPIHNDNFLVHKNKLKGNAIGFEPKTGYSNIEKMGTLRCNCGSSTGSSAVLTKEDLPKCFVKRANGSCNGNIGDYNENDVSRYLNSISTGTDGCMPDAMVEEKEKNICPFCPLSKGKLDKLQDSKKTYNIKRQPVKVNSKIPCRNDNLVCMNRPDYLFDSRLDKCGTMMAAQAHDAPIVNDKKIFDVRVTSEKSPVKRFRAVEANVARCLQAGADNIMANQGGALVTNIDNSEQEQRNTSIKDDKKPVFCATKDYHMTHADKELCGCQVASQAADPPIINQELKDTAKVINQNLKLAQDQINEESGVARCLSDGTHGSAKHLTNTLCSDNDNKYLVRRLTPKECARLQGFPIWWCDDLGIDNPGKEDIEFWKKVFRTQKEITGIKKDKSENEIIKFIKNPYRDCHEYKMWGNGVALPCVLRVLAGIAYQNELEQQQIHEESE